MARPEIGNLMNRLGDYGLRPIEREIEAVIGRPWSPAWNCWTLVRHFRPYFGVAAPDMTNVDPTNRKAVAAAIASHPERQNWKEGPAQPGSIVLMARDDGGRERHAGIYLVLDRPYILHVDQPHGTVLDAIPDVHARGWKHLTYYNPR